MVKSRIVGVFIAIAEIQSSISTSFTLQTEGDPPAHSTLIFSNPNAPNLPYQPYQPSSNINPQIQYISGPPPGIEPTQSAQYLYPAPGGYNPSNIPPIPPMPPVPSTPGIPPPLSPPGPGGPIFGGAIPSYPLPPSPPSIPPTPYPTHPPSPKPTRESPAITDPIIVGGEPANDGDATLSAPADPNKPDVNPPDIKQIINNTARHEAVERETHAEILVAVFMAFCFGCAMMKCGKRDRYNTEEYYISDTNSSDNTDDEEIDIYQGGKSKKSMEEVADDSYVKDVGDRSAIEPLDIKIVVEPKKVDYGVSADHADDEDDQHDI